VTSSASPTAWPPPTRCTNRRRSPKYLQLGGTFRRGGLTAEFFVGDAKSDFQRGDASAPRFNYYYGPATMSGAAERPVDLRLPGGLATSTRPNPANYAGLKPATGSPRRSPATNYVPAAPAYTAAQQPLTDPGAAGSWTPRLADTEERTAKLDLTYATPESIPFFKRFKGGFNLRDTGDSGARQRRLHPCAAGRRSAQPATSADRGAALDRPQFLQAARTPRLAGPPGGKPANTAS
jgi:hypothetical protein